MPLWRILLGTRLTPAGLCFFVVLTKTFLLSTSYVFFEVFSPALLNRGFAVVDPLQPIRTLVWWGLNFPLTYSRTTRSIH